MSTPSISQQIREQSGGAGAIVGKTIPLWILIFAGAALTWWQIDHLLAEVRGILHEGALQMQGNQSWALGLATLGVVIAVGFSVIAIMATGWWMAIPCVALILAPMAIFALWQPLWIWWMLGPFAGLLFLVLISVRGNVSGKVRVMPLAKVGGATFMVMVLISLFAPMVATHALRITPDRLRPEALEPLAEWIVANAPPEIVAAAISELPQSPAPEFVPLPPTGAPSVIAITPSPEASAPAPTPVSQEATPPAPAAPSAPATVPTTAPAMPAWEWGTATEPPQVIATPISGDAPPPKGNQPKQFGAATQPTEQQLEEALADPETPRRLALGLWHAISSSGEGYAGLRSQAPLVAGILLNLLLLPFVIIAPIASVILMAPVLWILRRMDYVRRLTVTISVPRYTLRGPKDDSTEGPDL